MSESLYYFECKLSYFVGKVISGKDFKNLFPDTEFVKLTNESENHNDYQYRDGLNIDIHEFNYDKKCCKGGLYFTTKEQMYKWISYSTNIQNVQIMFYVRKLVILDDSKIYIESRDKIKTDKLILEQRTEIDINEYTEFIKYGNHFKIDEDLTQIFNFIMKNKNPQQAKMFYLECVKHDGIYLYYVALTSASMIDREICLEAVKSCSMAIRYVPEKYVDNNFCLELVKHNNFALRNIPDHLKTIEICSIAVNKVRYLLENVPEDLKNQIIYA